MPLKFRSILNVGLETLCILICIILIIQIFTAHTCSIHKKKDTDRWFLLSLVSNIVMMTGDMGNWMLQGEQGPVIIRYLLFFCSALYFAASGVLMFSFYMYIYSYITAKDPLPGFLIKLNRTLMIVQIAMAASSPFFGTIFTYNNENIYQRGRLFFGSQATAVIAYLSVIWTLFKSRKKINKKEKIYFGTYVLLLAVSEMLQVMNYGIPLLNIAFTLSCLIVSLFIQSEVDEQFRKTEMQIEEERIALLENLRHTWEELTGQTIHALSNAVEAKDRYTNGHSLRVAEYSADIVRRMGWSSEKQKNMYYAGLLHDVGKIRIPDTIINKKGRLDDSEFEEVKLHTSAGYYILKEISSISDFAVAARWHHERYDGNGYPNGLAGEDIPIIARVIAVADAYDAMTSNRSYRSIMPQEKVRDEIERGSGTQFDPKIAKIMLSMIDEDCGYYMRQRDDGSCRTMLVICRDNEIIRLIEETIGPELNFDLITADSREEGINALRRSEPCLIILDYELSEDIIADIKEINKNIPIIIMSSDRSVLQKEALLKVNDCLTKPFTKLMLEESIRNICQKTYYSHPQK